MYCGFEWREGASCSLYSGCEGKILALFFTVGSLASVLFLSAALSQIGVFA